MIIEDYEALHKRARALRLRCAVKESRPVAECWCYCQGHGGAHLPCPDAPMPKAEDPLGVVRARIKELFGLPFWQEPRSSPAQPPDRGPGQACRAKTPERTR